MDTIDRNDVPATSAAKPRDKAKVLRAKPAKGEVDHAAVTREIIGRFPKILAELAK